MTRHEEREYALKLLFALESSGSQPDEVWFNGAETLETLPPPEGFAKQLFFGVADNREGLDGQIAEAADNWRIERISRVSLTVLRMAIYELKFMPDIGIKVTINEALELVRAYEGEKAVGFVNGVLGKIANS